jgi:dihydroorotate dehydrogenase (NAD+) catalytic subunit
LGNPPLRLVETSGGLLNSIGLANVGVEKFCSEKLEKIKDLDTVVLVNVAGSTEDEYAEVVQIIDRCSYRDVVDGYELNFSCPNVKEGGMCFGVDGKIASRLTRRIRKLTDKLVIVKLTPNITDPVAIAHVVEDAGADAVSLINTLVGMAVDIQTRRPKLGTIMGGLSGPAIKPVALAQVFQVAQAVRIPIIGIGGIMNATDVIEFLLVGASAVQFGTANYIHPTAPVESLDGLRSYCEEQKVSSFRELIGTLHLR